MSHNNSRSYNQGPSSPDVASLLSPSGEEVFHPVPQQQPHKQLMPHKPPPSGLFPSHVTTTPPGRSGYGWGLREGRMINLSMEDNPELKDVLQTLKESGIGKSHLEWLISGIPGRRMADGLVELYFREIDWTRYKMNRLSFTRRYVSFFDSIGRSPTSPKIDADTLKWLPLMFITLAIATLSAPADLVPLDEQVAWSRRFYGSARSGLEYAKALQRDNLDVLFAGLLASRYMLLTRRPAEGSTPLTTAFQLGLYRDGTVLNLVDKREVEIRRRAWAMLYHLDRTSSLLVGRPASISDAHTDTRPPANLDDEEIENGDFDPAGHPLTRPTQYTYVVLRHKLAEIMGRIAFHTFAIQLPDYSTVVNLDRELLAWRDSLPTFFRITTPDKSLDAKHPYLFVQRHLLSCEWFYTRITLNRPYLLRRKPQDGRYAYSRNAAIESATADLLSRREFVMAKGDLIVNSGGYRVLNSYMVLGVTIKCKFKGFQWIGRILTCQPVDPTSPQADELRHLLNVVSGRARDSEGRLSEPIVKEELAIVEFLTAKTSGAPTPKSSHPSNLADDHTPVDLLLGLAKTSSGRRAAEEEKRQLRLQQRRELDEQLKKNGNGATSASPWGYIAPSMPGLDVQQPFGNPNPFATSQPETMQRKVPRPLQPPSSAKRASNDWFDSMVRQPDFHQNPEPPITLPSSSTSASQQIFPDLSIFPNNTNQINNGFGDPHDQGLNTNQILNQFGNPISEEFDFADLGVDQQNMENVSFNPFALAQTVEEGSGSEGVTDDETAFLNFILTKFANNASELQER
ncbi:hypothetical protein P7C73_g5850, partial [Tremellales sp. Uapishka_1]